MAGAQDPSPTPTLRSPKGPVPSSSCHSRRPRAPTPSPGVTRWASPQSLLSQQVHKSPHHIPWCHPMGRPRPLLLQRGPKSPTLPPGVTRGASPRSLLSQYGPKSPSHSLGSLEDQVPGPYCRGRGTTAAQCPPLPNWGHPRGQAGSPSPHSRGITNRVVHQTHRRGQPSLIVF